MVGYVGASPTVTIKNCLSIGAVNSNVNGQFFGAVKSGKCSVKNSYYQGDNVNGSASTVTLTTQEATLVTDEELASGFVAAKLAPAFRQFIGTDSYPVLDAELPMVAEITEAGYATFYQEDTALEIPEGVEVFAGVKNGNWLTLVPIETAFAAEEPVILRGAAGYYMFAPAESAEYAETNDLLGTVEGIEADGKYVLGLPADADEGDEIGFWKGTPGTTIARCKAYLEDASGIKGFILSDGGATGIAEVETAVENGAIYNVAGQRLGKMQKGINIVNGKKVMIK